MVLDATRAAALRTWDRGTATARRKSRCVSVGATDGELLQHDFPKLGPSGVLDGSTLDVTDPLPGALDDAARIIEGCTIGELNVHVAGMWNEPDREVPQARAARRSEAEGEDAIWEVELLGCIGGKVQDQGAQ